MTENSSTTMTEAVDTRILTPTGDVSMAHVKGQFDLALMEFLTERNKSSLDRAVEQVFFID